MHSNFAYNTHSQGTQWPRLGRNCHFLAYNIICRWCYDLHQSGKKSQKSQVVEALKLLYYEFHYFVGLISKNGNALGSLGNGSFWFPHIFISWMNVYSLSYITLNHYKELTN